MTIDYDRRWTMIEQKHEEEKQLLLTQLQQSANRIQQLEKDLFFYKHKTRELRKSMATSIADQQPFILNTGNRSNSTNQS